MAKNSKPASTGQAVVVPSGEQWVLVVARPGETRPQLENFELLPRDGKDAAALKKIAARIKLRGVTLGTVLLPGEYQFLQVEAPDLADHGELKEALRWKVTDQVDFPVDQATLDCFDLPAGSVAAGRGRQVFVVVASNAVLKPKIESFQFARLPLAVIDVPEMGLRNVARLFEQSGRGLATLNFTAHAGELLFTFNGDICALRRIEVTLAQLESADAARLNDLFDRISLEVQRSIDNFERQFNAITLSRLVTPVLPTVPGFIDYLRDYLSIKVDALDLTEVVDFPALPELRETRRQAEWLPVIGAALRGFGE